MKEGAVGRLLDAWDQELADGYWSHLTDDELHRMESFLWATHQDALMEFLRRKMIEEREK